MMFLEICFFEIHRFEPEPCLIFKYIYIIILSLYQHALPDVHMYCTWE